MYLTTIVVAVAFVVVFVVVVVVQEKADLLAMKAPHMCTVVC